LREHLSRKKLDKLLSLAEKGIQELIIVQKQALKWSEGK
jgi:ribonuclease PH